MILTAILKPLLSKLTSFKAVLGLLVAFSIAGNIFLYKRNLRLSEGLELASNNIEAYQGLLDGAAEKNNVLVMDIQLLQNSKDSVVNAMMEYVKETDAKLKNLQHAATQTQHINVNGGKGVKDSIIYINTPTKQYIDSIRFNDLTLVSYTIGEDTVSIDLDVSNTQYLYTFKKKEWKNKKNFLKRLFTLDFKKVWKYRYEIHNSNDLINTSDVRVIEIND